MFIDCNQNNLSKNDECPAVTPSPPVNVPISEEHSSERTQTVSSNELLPSPKASGHRSRSEVVVTDNGELDGKGDSSSTGHGALAALIPLCLIVAIAGWLLYAYRNPHTKSGQMLIRVSLVLFILRCIFCCYITAFFYMQFNSGAKTVNNICL